jgi:methionyl-tRNA formyltransferase
MPQERKLSDLTSVVLCGRSPRHIYVANALCERTRVLAIVHESGARLNAAKMKRYLDPRTIARRAWRWLRDRRRYAGGKERKFFFPDGIAVLSRPELVHFVPHIDHPDVVALVDRLSPDVIAVFGTSLIRGPLLTRGRLGIFNLHGGLSPRYRGADCTFWALYNGEPDQVGCTLHRIDAGIDTGRLMAHVCPAVREGDDELTLFYKGVRDSAAVYGDLFDRLERGEKIGQPQPDKGRLYQVRDRGWRHERALARKMAEGALRGVDLAPRVRWFNAEEKPDG